MDKPDLTLFPSTPGVYLYKDADGRILYVGKARRLRERLASYFRDEGITPKTRVMLRHAVSIDILRTGTEKEALLLEASLIKKHRPRYNIVLRDDKEYLLFRIGSEHPYPRVEIIRRNQRKGRDKQARIFGPFSSGGAARETWRLIHKNFPLRRCRDRSFANRTRPCLYYDMGQCLGPCVLPVPREEYLAMLDKVALLLSGRSRDLLRGLREEMARAAEALRYEEAARLRDQIRAVERTLERQSVVLGAGVNLDLVGVAQVPEGLALGVVFVRDGLLIDGRNFFWPGLSVEETPELIASFLTQYYLNRQGLGESIPPRIVAPWLPESELWQSLEAALSEYRGGPVHISVPRGPDEDSLALMAASNAREAVKSSARPAVAELLAARLHASEPIRRIEAVDISHTGGRQTRAGMVVFENEEPVPQDFRTYALDGDSGTRSGGRGGGSAEMPSGAPPVAGASQKAPPEGEPAIDGSEDTASGTGWEAGDDYAALAAWATRRAAAGPPWPQLVLVDGGKGQLAAVHRAFAGAGVADCFLLASIAKARNDEGRADRRAGNVADRIFLPGRSNPVALQPGSPELLFLQRVRDAVHDFVIGRHRRARSAATLAGELTRLPGVGPATAKLLFERFGSLAAMAEAGAEALEQVPGIGKVRAGIIYNRLALLMGKNAE